MIKRLPCALAEASADAELDGGKNENLINATTIKRGITPLRQTTHPFRQAGHLKFTPVQP